MARIRRLWLWLSRWLEKLLTPSLLLLSVIFVVAAVCLFALLAAELATELHDPPPRWAAEARSVILFWMDASDVSEPVASRVLAFFAIVAAAWSVVVPLLALHKHRLAVSAARTIEIKRIHKQGTDDIATLVDLLKEAKEAIIFAGRFDWLLKSDAMKAVISDLASRDAIVLVTPQTESVVQSAFDNYEEDKRDTAFRDLVLKHLVPKQTGIDIRLTVVRYDSGDWSCCTMVTEEQGTSRARAFNMIVFPTTNDRRVLLNIIKTLCDIKAWKDKRESSNSQDNVPS